MVLKSDALVKVADGPVSLDHKPVPGVGSFPARVMEVVPPGWHWSAPAWACIGPCEEEVVTNIWSAEEAQAFAIVQVKV